MSYFLKFKPHFLILLMAVGFFLILMNLYLPEKAVTPYKATTLPINGKIIAFIDEDNFVFSTKTNSPEDKNISIGNLNIFSVSMKKASPLVIPTDLNINGKVQSKLNDQTAIIDTMRALQETSMSCWNAAQGYIAGPIYGQQNKKNIAINYSLDSIHPSFSHSIQFLSIDWQRKSTKIYEVAVIPSPRNPTTSPEIKISHPDCKAYLLNANLVNCDKLPEGLSCINSDKAQKISQRLQKDRGYPIFTDQSSYREDLDYGEYSPNFSLSEYVVWKKREPHTEFPEEIAILDKNFNTIKNITLPTPKFLQSDGAIRSVKCFSCGCSCYRSYQIFHNTNGLFAALTGWAADNGDQGIYKLDQNKWIKIVQLDEYSRRISLSPTNCQIAWKETPIEHASLKEDGQIKTVNICNKPH